MKLYQFPFSHYSAKVKVILDEKRLAYEKPDFDPAWLRSPEFRAINPVGKVPLLVDGDFALSESEVIVEYLEEAYPAVPVLPKDLRERARCRWLSRFHDLYLGPQVSTLYFSLSDGRAGKPEFTKEIDRFYELLAELESVIDPRPFFMGEQFTIADATYTLTYHYVMTLPAAHGRPVDEATHIPKLSRWFKAVEHRPSVAPMLAAAKKSLGQA